LGINSTPVSKTNQKKKKKKKKKKGRKEGRKEGNLTRLITLSLGKNMQMTMLSSY
jgi:hypothetical protein